MNGKNIGLLVRSTKNNSLKWIKFTLYSIESSISYSLYLLLLEQFVYYIFN